MCGIVGGVGPGVERAILEGMNARQVHRGPDSGGIWQETRLGVGLAMRRLSIVDVSDGDQPMRAAHDEVVVVYNGEIFNAAKLRRELEAAGRVFRTSHSDTEILIHGWLEWGESLPARLNGMFAFVLWDSKRELLFGARDRLGIKPLYLYEQGTNFWFASELKSLFAIPGFDRGPAAVDLDAVATYLSLQYIPSPATIFRDVRRLGPGHSFHFDPKQRRLQIERYYAPPRPKHPAPARGELVTRFREELVRSVDDWLMSDVPVGCSLSGGIDSAAVVGIMASRQSSPIATYTLGFSEATDADERALARIVAQRWGTQHTEIVISADAVLQDLPHMVRSLDEPYAGGLPSWYVFKRMHEDVKVAMTGTGGDELFGSYFKWKAWMPERARLIRSSLRAIRKHGLAEWSAAPRGALYPIKFGAREVSALMLQPVGHAGRASRAIEARLREIGGWDPRDALPSLDIQLQLSDEFLHMTDRFSMAWSIEARTPFLDAELVDFALSVPGSARLDPATYKGLLREVVAPYVPAEFFSAPKRGFVLPLERWTRQELRPLIEELLGRRFIRAQGLFDAGAVRAVVDPHLSGVHVRTEQVWTLLMFQLWWQSHIEGTASADVGLIPGTGLSSLDAASL